MIEEEIPLRFPSRVFFCGKGLSDSRQPVDEIVVDNPAAPCERTPSPFGKHGP